MFETKYDWIVAPQEDKLPSETHISNDFNPASLIAETLISAEPEPSLDEDSLDEDSLSNINSILVKNNIPLKLLENQIIETHINKDNVNIGYYYFDDLVPYPANELIADSRSGYIGFSSFIGKAICWGGIPLIIVLTSVLVSTYKNANKEVRRYIIPVIIGAFYSLGSLATPYICLWFAILRMSSLTEKV